MRNVTITINTDYKIKTSLEEAPTDLELKPLPDNLEYVFLEEPSFLPVIISSKLSSQNKGKLIQLLDDKKPVVLKQRSPWVSPIHCVPKKGGITVVTNENDELVSTRTVTGWRANAFRAMQCPNHIPKVHASNLSRHDRRIRQIGAVLEFDIEIKDRKGTENVAADHLSRIENEESSDDSDVDDNFPRETLMEINTKDEPWFADFANYLVADIIPKRITYQQKNKFFSDIKHYF
ncbi:hypothetical protein Tco_1161755 [Tanacetum coccineum]